MDFPKPHPPRRTEPETLEEIKLPEVSKEQGARVFVRKPHLTQRPFNNPALHTLRDGMTKSVKIKQK